MTNPSPTPGETARETLTERLSRENLRRILRVVCCTIWDKRVPSGEHLWSIPADPRRDFDCILSDAIEELVTGRVKLAEAEATIRTLRQELATGEEYRDVLKAERDAALAQVEGLMGEIADVARFKYWHAENDQCQECGGQSFGPGWPRTETHLDHCLRGRALARRGATEDGQ